MAATSSSSSPASPPPEMESPPSLSPQPIPLERVSDFISSNRPPPLPPGSPPPPPPLPPGTPPPSDDEGVIIEEEEEEEKEFPEEIRMADDDEGLRRETLEKKTRRQAPSGVEEEFGPRIIRMADDGSTTITRLRKKTRRHGVEEEFRPRSIIRMADDGTQEKKTRAQVVVDNARRLRRLQRPYQPHQPRYFNHMCDEEKSLVKKIKKFRNGKSMRVANKSTVHLYKYRHDKLPLLIGKLHRTHNILQQQYNIHMSIPSQRTMKWKLPITIIGYNAKSLFESLCEIERIVY